MYLILDKLVCIFCYRRNEPPQDDIGDYQKNKALLWTAPEILRMGDEAPYYGTPKGDVYSFAIIIQEILYRTMPFMDDGLSPEGS